MKFRPTGVIMAAVMCLTSLSMSGLAAAPTESGVQAVIYVSPDGSDSGDGSLGSPFLTLGAARDAVRKINGNMSGDIIVRLRGGEYRITEPVCFDTRDSGTNGHRIIYTAYENEVPVINGAQQVTGWTKDESGLYSAPLDRSVKLRNLYVNDRRANMGSISVQCRTG